MLLGLVLFYVGAVLCLNGIWLLGKIGDAEIGVIDVFVGSITLAVALYSAFGPNADLSSVKAAALTLMFTFTYFWVAWNRWNKSDGRGLGWFCLFVAITTVPVFLQGFSQCTNHMGRLVRNLLVVLGRAVVLVLSHSGARPDESDPADRRDLRVAGRLHRLASWLPSVVGHPEVGGDSDLGAAS